MRVGIGHDTHRLEDGGPLKIGGVEIPFEKHLVGHSDADVLLHAVTDAILGAAALGDIGELFPNTSDENINRDSAEMLKLAQAELNKHGFTIVNIDCIVFAERPKLSAFKLPIQNRMEAILGIDPGLIGVKAKTGENVGPVGRGEIIAAECIVMIQEK